MNPMFYNRRSAASSTSLSGAGAEEEQRPIMSSMPCRGASSYCHYEDKNDDASENGEHYYNKLEMNSNSLHDSYDLDGALDDSEVNIYSEQNNERYHEQDAECYNDDDELQNQEYLSDDEYNGNVVQDHYNDEIESNAGENWDRNDNGYYTEYSQDDEQYNPFDIGDMHQLPCPPSLNFGNDDNSYEADGEYQFDDEEEQQEEQNVHDYDDARNDLPQLSAESLDVINRIEVLMESIVTSLNKMEAPKITGYKAPSHDDEDDDDSSFGDARDIMNANLNEHGDQTFCRSWDHIGHCRTFTSICLVMSFIHQLLLSMRTTTTREVYYVFVTHFRSQKECDSAILDVAKVLGVSRRSLGLSASPKGWFCGCVEITRRGVLPSGKDVSGTIDGTALSSIQGLPITREWIERDEEGRNEQGVEISVSSKDAKCILVIEKEGVFNRLSEERLYDRFPCIMVTGKGFPDLCTRALVKTLHDELDLPVLGLCDMNPYGVSVLSVYFCAGNRMGVDGNYRYSVPIEWLGLRPTEVKVLHEKHRFPNSVFQALTDLDRKRMISLTDETNPFLEDDEKDEVADEMKYKVELEALYWLGAEFLGEWVFRKLQSRFEEELGG